MCLCVCVCARACVHAHMCVCVYDLAMHFYENSIMIYKVFTQTNRDWAFLYFKTFSDALFLIDTCLSLLEMRLELNSIWLPSSDSHVHQTIILWFASLTTLSLILDLSLRTSCHHKKCCSC